MEDNLKVLVNQMGFSNTEARIALEDCNGDLRKAVENLLAGKYSPPSYQDPPPVYEEIASNLVPTACSNLYPNLKTNSNESSKLSPDNSNCTSLSTDQTAPVLDALSKFPENSLMDTQPPPYEKYDKNEKIQSWERATNIFHFNSADSIITAAKDDVRLPSTQRDVDDARCDICYSILFPKTEDSSSCKLSTLDIIQHHEKIYHQDCFSRKYSPKCAHCCFPLSKPDLDRDLSGQYLVYQGKDYHVECYERYAGPRCTLCFNVIIEKPNGEFSGHWVVNGPTGRYHVECYQKKEYSLWRAKNS